MSVTWATALAEIRKILDDVTFESGGTNTDYLLTWANRIQNEVHWEIDFKQNLVNGDVTGTTSDYYVNLPTDFLKWSDRFTKVRVDDEYIDIISVEDLNDADPDHDTYTANTEPDYVAIEGGKVYIYPMFSGTLTVENYFRMPVELTAAGNIDIPNDYFALDLTVNGVCGKYGFPFLNEPELAKERRDEFHKLLEQYRVVIKQNDSRKIMETKYY